MNEYLWAGFEDELEKLASLKDLVKVVAKKLPRTSVAAKNLGKRVGEAAMKATEDLGGKAVKRMKPMNRNFTSAFIGASKQATDTYQRMAQEALKARKAYPGAVKNLKESLKKDIFG